MGDKFNVKELLKILIVLTVIVLLSLMFPSNKSNQYESSPGTIWANQDLFANEDFEILKSPEDIEKEASQLSSKILPFYKSDESQTEKSVQDITQYLTDSFGALKGQEASVKSLIGNLYKRGVLDIRASAPAYETVVNGNKKRIANDAVYDKTEFNAAVQRELSNFGLKQADRNKIDIVKLIKPNKIFDQKSYQEKLKVAKENIPQVESIVKKGELIISKGEEIDFVTSKKLNAFNAQQAGEGFSGIQNWIRFLGFLILTCLIIGALIFYLRKYFPTIDDKIVSLVFVMMWPLLMGFFVYAIENFTNLSVYLIPFCIVPIIVKNFYHGRLALFVHVVVILIASILSKEGYEFTFLQILAGIITVLFVSETRYWNKFFMAILLILGTYVLGQIGLDLITEGSFLDINFKTLLLFVGNAILLMLAYPFIPLVEKIFGFTSSISLVELADMNRPLLKELSLKAPGTLQHSLQVANLAEAAADKIGANSLLVKTGALYHDIGKMVKPEYYIENAKPGQNAHEALNDNFESAKIIIGHVIEGEKMAKKARLPQEIIDLIVTHHGTTRVEYFFRNQRNNNPHLNTDESLFRYPGPKPKSKEQTILMIADSLEAASKSLKNPTGKDIDDLVDKIVNYKISEGQLSESELSFEEIEKCTTVFKSLLRSINHVRIEYPDEVK